MDIEIAPHMEGNPIVFSFSSFDDGCGVMIGHKRWSGEPGAFKYEWIAEYVTRDEMISLHDAVAQVIELMPVPEDECEACRSESAGDPEPVAG